MKIGPRLRELSQKIKVAHFFDTQVFMLHVLWQIWLVRQIKPAQLAFGHTLI